MLKGVTGLFANACFSEYGGPGTSLEYTSFGGNGAVNQNVYATTDDCTGAFTTQSGVMELTCDTGSRTSVANSMPDPAHDALVFK